MAAGIRGCVQPAPVPLPSDDGMASSAASCTLDAVRLTVVAYPTEQAVDAATWPESTSGPRSGYFAQGVGYVAAPDLLRTTVSKQKALAEMIITSLGGSVVFFETGS